MKGKIIAVDFDGTCVDHRYPDVGQDLEGAVDCLKDLVKAGNKIILYTMRSGETLAAAEQWFKDREIEVWAVNKNPQQKFWTKSPKIYANTYIDDAALGAPLYQYAHMERPGIKWSEVRKILLPDTVVKKKRRTTVIKDWESFKQAIEYCDYTVVDNDLEKGSVTGYYVSEVNEDGILYELWTWKNYCNEEVLEEFPITVVEHIADEDEDDYED